MALDSNQYNQNNFDIIIDNENLSIREQNDKIIKYLRDKGICYYNNIPKK